MHALLLIHFEKWKNVLYVLTSLKVTAAHTAPHAPAHDGPIVGHRRPHLRRVPRIRHRAHHGRVHRYAVLLTCHSIIILFLDLFVILSVQGDQAACP